MKTLTLTRDINLDTDATNMAPPAFIGDGVASIQVRRSEDAEFTERWVSAKAFVSEAEQATDFETSVYMQTRDHEFLAIMNEPDPIHVHTADEWADAFGEYDDAQEILGVAA